MGGNAKVLVIGGGISGLTAAIEASEAGAEVVLVEKNPYLGGRVAQMHQYFPKLCPPACGLEINLRRVRTSSRIRCLTLARVEGLSGGPGKYQVTIVQQPRRVNRKCTACGACVAACPTERPDEYNLGMGKTKAVYLPFPAAYPMRYVIDAKACTGSSCAKCAAACKYGAIELDAKAETIREEAGAVVVATGWEPYDAARLEDLGFGKHRNVITNLMLERLASRTGPTGGKIQRPSDGKGLGSVAFVQCAGSRDENHLKHCSGVCCMGSLKQARYVREQYPDARIYIFFIDIRAPGRLEDFYAEVQKDDKVTLLKGKVAKITADADGGVQVEAEDTLSGVRLKQKVDLAVLATGLVPSDPAGRVEAGGGLRKDEHGFLVTEQGSPGIVPAGCAKRPVDVAACVRDATGAALKALQGAR
jgi:heterodisulfide reductase subunit A-like polyferredoxin